jgi:glycerol-3-phosphate acyltransferase PlsY
VLVRLFRREDIREQGSGNIGATNVARSGGTKLGIVTLLLDIGKAYAAVVIARHLLPGAYDVQVAAAVAAVMGHVYPVCAGLSRRQGRGQRAGRLSGPHLAVGGGILLVFAVVFALTRYVSLASIVGSATFPLFGFFFVSQHTLMVRFGFLFIPLLIIVKHHGNIRRLLSGRRAASVSAPQTGQGMTPGRKPRLGRERWRHEPDCGSWRGCVGDGAGDLVGASRRALDGALVVPAGTGRGDAGYGSQLPLPAWLQDSLGRAGDIGPGGGGQGSGDCALRTPSEHLRGVLRQIAPLLTSDQIVVSATKGLEPKSFCACRK